MTSGVVRRAHGSFVFRRQGAVKDGPKGRRLWRSRSLTAPCRRKILIQALDGQASTESSSSGVAFFRLGSARGRARGAARRRGARAVPRGFIILYRLSRMMRGFVRRARPVDRLRRGRSPVDAAAVPGFPLTRSRFQREWASPARGEAGVSVVQDDAGPRDHAPGLNGEVWGWAARRRGRSRAARH